MIVLCDQYAWMKLLDPKLTEKVIFFDINNLKDETTRLEPLYQTYYWLDITRIYKSLGFYMLQSLDKKYVIPTYGPNDIHQIHHDHKWILKPVTGARTVGVMIVEASDVFKICLSPDLFESEDIFFDYCKEHNIDIFKKDAYKSYIYETYKDKHFIIQPFLENVKEEYRLYVGFDGELFEYSIERPVPYLEKRDKEEPRVSITKHDFITDIADVIRRFIKLTGKHYPFVSVDILVTDDEKAYIVDYGIEFNYINLTKESHILETFKEWLNKKLSQKLKELYS